jgi:hypothetical protein
VVSAPVRLRRRIFKEISMRKIVRSAALAAFLLTASIGFAAPPATSRSASGTIVIVFKDGHRQSYNLADIERVEFPTTDVASNSAYGPSRGHFLGKWECGDGSGSNFYITLFEDGNAMRSIRNVHGRWNYVNGEAQITWDDGAEDAIRKVGSRFQKFAYNAGKSFTDTPENVTNARNTTPKPI